MTDVRVLLNGSTSGGNFNTHLGGLLVGTWRIQCCPRISRSTRVIILRSATQDQRELRYFHARNFPVQPQAIMDQQVEGCRLVWSTRSKELMFLKDCVPIIRFSNT